MRSLMVCLAVLAAAFIMPSRLSAQELSQADHAALKSFAVEAMANAEEATRNGTDLQKARYLMTKLCNRLAMHVQSVNSTRSSRVGSLIANFDRSRLSCSHLTNMMLAVFHGAGIKSERTFELVADKNSWKATLTADPNRNHAVPCLIFEGKVYTFDAWAYAVDNTRVPLSFSGGGYSKWNGMPLDKWAADMAKRDYVRFSGNAREESSEGDRTRWHKTAQEAAAEAMKAQEPKHAGGNPGAGKARPSAPAVKTVGTSRGQWALVTIAGKDENQAPQTCTATFSDTGLEADVAYAASNREMRKYHASVHWNPPPTTLTPGETLRFTGTAANGTLELYGNQPVRSLESTFVVPDGAPGRTIDLDFDAQTRGSATGLCWNYRVYRYRWIPKGEGLPDPKAATREVKTPGR